MKKLLVMLLVLASILSITVSASALDIGIVLPTKDEDRWLADEAKFYELIEGKRLFGGDHVFAGIRCHGKDQRRNVDHQGRESADHLPL